MKNNTIIAAINLGFDFEHLDSEIELSEVLSSIMDFLNENSEKLEKVYDECEVTGSGSRQNVNHGDYTSSGDIIHWHEYYYEPRQKIEHSDYFFIDDNGIPKCMVLWCWSLTEAQEKENNESWDI